MANKRLIFILAGLVLMAGAVCACQAGKNDKVALYENAVLSMDKGDFIKPQALLQKALKIDPNYAKANYALAVCYLRQVPADVTRAQVYCARAKALGFVVPEWFNDYVKIVIKSKTK